MFWKHVRAIATLPFTVLVIVPAIIVWLSKPRFVWTRDFPVNAIGTVIGLLCIALGLFLLYSTISLFIKIGQGTLAPWDETQHFIAVGIYRYVRNPMHIGVFTVLLGESILFGSQIIFGIFVFAVILHLFYIPMIEEKGLERRFGESYNTYRQHVPRWIPRRTAWQPASDSN